MFHLDRIRFLSRCIRKNSNLARPQTLIRLSDQRGSIQRLAPIGFGIVSAPALFNDDVWRGIAGKAQLNEEDAIASMSYDCRFWLAISADLFNGLKIGLPVIQGMATCRSQNPGVFPYSPRSGLWTPLQGHLPSRQRVYELVGASHI